MRCALASVLRRSVEYHDELPSTQDRARELSEAAGAEAVVVADHQSSGRGTRGRTWVAPAGTALLASWVIRPMPAEPALFTLLASIAVARALAAFGHDARVKWPNDVLLGGRKVAGVLAHGAGGAGEGALVLGTGMNVHQRREDLAPEIASTATSLAIAGGGADRLALLCRLSDALRAVAADTAAALDEWRERSVTLDREVRVSVEGAESTFGRAEGVDADGALLVRTRYGAERIVTGEVKVLE